MANKELEFIEIIKNSLFDSSFIGDDCALLSDFNLAISSDSLIEDVHFSLSTTSISSLAKKALRVNISDILASGAKPLYALVNLSGKLEADFVKEFYSSLNTCALEFGVKIVGGDLTGGEKLSIAITALGDIRGRNISSRKNAKVGYLLCVCGKFGLSARGLLDLSHSLENEFTNVHQEPVLHPSCSSAIATRTLEPYAMMDSSDGLINALEWIAKQSKVGFKLNFSKIPTNKNLTREEVLFGAEDYSLVCALSKDDYKRVGSNELVVIGETIGEQTILIDGQDYRGEKRQEFCHFS